MAIPKEDLTEITIRLRDPDNQLIRLIDHIGRASAPGHSFEVIVDPNDSEFAKSFFIDGDGAFYIEDLKINDKKVKVKNDKLVEYIDKIREYLGKIQDV